MVKRKSPRRHHVKSYIRNGYRVSDYIRGKGTVSSSTLTRKRKIEKDKFEEFNITFDYGKGRKEKVTVMARDMDDAMNLALELRENQDLKPKNAIVKDGLGSFLGTVTGKVIGGLHVASAKYRLETEKAKREAEEIKAMSEAERERKTRKMIYRARVLGDRVAQVWCEKYGIAWQQV